MVLFPGVIEDYIRQFHTTEDNITRAVESFNNTVQQAAWNPYKLQSRYQYRICICNKRKTRKKEASQGNRCPDAITKNKLNRALEALKSCSERNQEIQEYLNKISATSETNYSL